MRKNAHAKQLINKVVVQAKLKDAIMKSYDPKTGLIMMPDGKKFTLEGKLVGDNSKPAPTKADFSNSTKAIAQYKNTVKMVQNRESKKHMENHHQSIHQKKVSSVSETDTIIEHEAA